jgi:hypothetical protein
MVDVLTTLPDGMHQLVSVVLPWERVAAPYDPAWATAFDGLAEMPYDPSVQVSFVDASDDLLQLTVGHRDSDAEATALLDCFDEKLRSFGASDLLVRYQFGLSPADWAETFIDLLAEAVEDCLDLRAWYFARYGEFDLTAECRTKMTDDTVPDLVNGRKLVLDWIAVDQGRTTPEEIQIAFDDDVNLLYAGTECFSQSGAVG